MKPITNKPILVVEDDLALNKLIQKKLQNEGYNTHGVTSDIEAVKWLSENEFSLVLIDYILGNKDATEVVKAVERNLKFALPFVIMTGNGDERIAVEMMKMGALDYMIKDAAFLDLLPAIVKQVLEHLHVKQHYLKTQRELEESELRHRMLAESINDLIDKKDVNARFTYLSPLCKTLLGYEEEDLLGKPIFDFIHPDDKSNYEVFHLTLFKSGCSHPIIKYRFRKKNGHYIWLETNTKLLKNLSNNGETELVSVSRDITEAKKAEELVKEKEKAELANKAKSEFLANISHEIRNPMNAIIGMAGALLKTELTDDQKKYINSIRISSSNLMNLINDILDFSKIEAKQIEIYNTDFNLNDVVDEVVTMFENQAVEKNLQLNYIIADDVETNLHGDSFKLKQILTNLLNNAIKFTDEGQVKIFVTQESSNQKAVRIKIAITDTGIGIKESDFNKIFNIFTQLDSTPSKKYQGTGLGLSIVKKLTDLLSGNITFESKYGKGATFTVQLPFAISKNKAVNYGDIFKESKPDVDIGKIKVLLAEDDGINQLYLKGFLESYKWKVITAFNGEQAVQKYKKEHFDIILMDGQMPKMDGFEATKEIRKYEEEENRNYTPVIAITGYAVKGDRERFIEAGMDDYITKPINETKLIEVIKKLCAKKAK